jgi:hypothetical protein
LSSWNAPAKGIRSVEAASELRTNVGCRFILQSPASK